MGKGTKRSRYRAATGDAPPPPSFDKKQSRVRKEDADALWGDGDEDLCLSSLVYLLCERMGTDEQEGGVVYEQKDRVGLEEDDGTARAHGLLLSLLVCENVHVLIRVGVV